MCAAYAWRGKYRFCLFFAFLTFTVSAFAGTCPSGDLTEDCKVDINDLTEFASQWLQTEACEEGPCADFVEPMGVDFLDFGVLAGNWQVKGTPLVINEFMASNNNDSNIADPCGDYDDWIEIYNAGNTPLDLAGMYLTDDLDNPTKWQIPSGYPAQTTVPVDGFVIIWADEEPAEGPLHAEFKLSAGGEAVALFDIDGSTLIDGLEFGQQYTNISYGRYPDATPNWRFFPTPTPAADNNGAYYGQIEQVEFSKERGFYDANFTLTLACTTSGASIYYTIDGRPPIAGEAPAAGSILYTTPFAVNSSKPIRAAALKTGWMPSPIETHTYMFGVSAANKLIPVLSIVGDYNNSLFPPNGVMAYPKMRGIAYERPVSFEIINMLPDSNFQGDCGIRVQGSNYHRDRYITPPGSNWLGNYNYNKYSFRLIFRDTYGKNRFEYPLFPLSAIQREKGIVLRGGHNDAGNPFILDEFARRLHRDTGACENTGTIGNVFLNGVYKAYYNPCEHVDEEFLQEWYDSVESWDVITQGGVRDGDSNAWNATVNYIRYNDMSNQSNYLQADTIFDIKAFIDYLIVETYCGNRDWPGNNWTVAAERSSQGRFRYFVWDTELAMIPSSSGQGTDQRNWNCFTTSGGLNSNANSLSYLYVAFKASPEFKLLFADHIHRHFNNGGALIQTRLHSRHTELRDVIINVVNPSPYLNYLETVFIPLRQGIVFGQYNTEGLLGPFGAPVYNVNGVYKHGGYVSTSDTLTLTDPCSTGGTIYYTLDGNDPRVSFTGAVSSSAIAYSGGFTLDKSTNLKSRIYKSSTSQWSPINEAVYEVGSVKNSLRITEIMYNALDTNEPNDEDSEYIELKNTGGSAVNLNLVKFDKGVDFTFGPNTLAAGQHVLVVKDVNAFTAKYGAGRPIAGQYTGSLNNGGERVRLLDAIGTAILDFNYKDGWRAIADGQGYSLTIINPANPDPNTWKYNDGWRASAYVNGSPGWDDSGLIPNPGAIAINEVMSHSSDTAPDWVELRNTAASAINIGGWYLSDSDTELMKYRFAAGTVIAANGYLVVREDVNFGEAAVDPGRLIPFALSENGDLVRLTSALDANGLLTGYREKEDFGASETDVSFGRYYKASTDSYNFVPMEANTPSTANAYPKVGPIVITEIMYHPDWPTGGNYANDEYEYIELRNISGSPVTLYDSAENEPWKFTGGIDYTFPSPPDAVTIPAGSRILVVKNPTAFSWRYPGVSTSIIYGPYDGWLANDGEQLELGKPGDIDEFGQRQYIRVERINYSDGSHPGDDPADLWPIPADGQGKSLTQTSTTQYGNDPNNWTAAAPTPGS